MTYFDDLDDFEKTVFLMFENHSHRGPGMVVTNLQKGLEKIGVTYYGVYHSRAAKYTGILQFCMPDLLYQYSTKKPLLGPNLFVLPTDNPKLCDDFDNFIVPSQWVKDLYITFDLLKNKNIFVWPVGIDTEIWKPTVENKKEIDCFIYFKNRTEQDLEIVKAICRKFNLTFKVIGYGSYLEKELKELCEKAKFAILLTGTESQGIAYLNILSSNIPCYVFNTPTWKDEYKKISCEATSVPYWDERCGVIANNVDLNHFKQFLDANENNKFEPRNYILDNLTLEKSAQAYYNMLRECHGEEPVKFR
jgi:glycosyltransferase involved in cell wall biosynthesis